MGGGESAAPAATAATLDGTTNDTTRSKIFSWRHHEMKARA
jgi:hypothetical protein